jgi:ribose-phosphate pyrophosphokinase
MTDFNENLYYTVNGFRTQRISISTMTFPGGEVGVNINTGSLSWLDTESNYVDTIDLVAKIQNSDQLMAMFLATDALRRVYPNARLDLNIPYFPYARQDRVCNPGEALSAKLMATLINSQNYATVTVVDPHSPVLVAALDRCFVVDQITAFKGIKDDWSEWTIIAPDAGAAKKTEEFAKAVGAKAVVYFQKHRELSTGKITGMAPIGDVDPDGKYLVLDDICDGGRTFVELVKCISYVEYLELAVTHGIFSKGVEVLTDVFDHVYTTDSLPQGLNPKLTVLKY